MEFKLKQICLAVSLPILAFLTAYWIRQRKKPIGDGCSKAGDNAETIAEQVASLKCGDQVAEQNDRQTNAKGDYLEDHESTVESRSSDCCSTAAVCCKAANRQSIDQDKTIGSADNQTDNQPDNQLDNKLDHQTADQPAKPASLQEEAAPVKLNNNDNDFESKDQINDSQTANKPEAHHSTNNISSSDKLDSADSVDRLDSQSTVDDPPTDLNKSNTTKKPDELHASSKSLAEGEEMFETNNETRERRLSNSSTGNISTGNISAANISTANPSTANASTVNESAKADTTAMTFDTARDLSINDASVRVDDSTANADDSLMQPNDSLLDYASSANATVNSSIRSLKDSTLNSMNCSIQTLRSVDSSNKGDLLNDSKLNDSKLNDSKLNDSKVNGESAAESVQRDEEVKEDYLNATAVNNSNGSTVKADDIVKNDEKPNDSASEEVDTSEETHLNLTEAEFKNDTVDQLIEGIKAIEICEEEANKTIEKEESVEEAGKAQEESAVESEAAKSSDDSIIFDGVVTVSERSEPAACKPKPAQNGQPESVAKESAAKESAEPKQPVNLNDSSDVEIVFETCEDIKPKQMPNLNGRPARARGEKPSSLAGTPSKQAVKQQVPNNHVNSKPDEFTFEIPKDLCGLLIGAKGSFINPVMKRTNTTISLLQHPTMLNMNLCSIKGHFNGINEALATIRERFPLNRFPQVTLLQTPNLIPVETISEAAQLHLPEGIHCDVILSDFVNPAHLFLQQPTHPSFHLLQRLDEYMISTYNFQDTPGVDEPAVGIICAVKRGEGWYRAIVTDCSDLIKVRLLDYGGYITVPKTSLRQVQRDYMSIPFQAAECFLANVEPASGLWSADAHAYFRSLTEKQFLRAFIVGYTEDRIPTIQLFRAVNNQAILINKELCDTGYAIYVE